MTKVLLCEDCIEAIKSRGEHVYVGEKVERWEYDDISIENFRCGWCGDDWLFDEEPHEDDELFECMW